jgi:hypothetical protein
MGADATAKEQQMTKMVADILPQFARILRSNAGIRLASPGGDPASNRAGTLHGDGTLGVIRSERGLRLTLYVRSIPFAPEICALTVKEAIFH